VASASDISSGSISSCACMIVCVCVCVCVMQENVCIFLSVRVHVSEKKCALREKRHWARDIEQRRSMQKKA
jgi:hypothetical protein